MWTREANPRDRGVKLAGKPLWWLSGLRGDTLNERTPKRPGSIHSGYLGGRVKLKLCSNRLSGHSQDVYINRKQ